MPPEPRVLLVDGDYDACDALVAALQVAGLPVDFAYDAESALELTRKRNYALVLLAHWPPYLDAISLRHRLRRIGREGSRSWMLVNGLKDTLAEAATRAGFDALWPHQGSTDRLIAAIADTVRLCRPKPTAA